MSAGVIAVPTIMPLRVPVIGQPKNYIDTNTLIELNCDSPNTKIYYTVDNTRPNPVKRLGENTTLIYTEPFMLHSGKRTVKALAQHTLDFRESNVVTKTFSVAYAEQESGTESESDNEANFQIHMKKNKQNQIISNQVTSSIMEGKPIDRKDAWQNQSPVPELKELNVSRENFSMTPKYAYSTTDTDLKFAKKCVYCNAPRPHSSKARFCSDCGKPVPVDPDSADIEPGSMGMCTKCRSYVPLNQPMCIVCEEPIKQKPKAVTSVTYENKIVCGSCGTHNPINLTHCASCEHRFPQAVHQGEKAPPLPKLDGKLIRCPSCTRANNPDARFCDWCGSKPIPEQSPLTCTLCKTNNPPYSRFCGHCGSTFAPPNRLDPRNSDLGDEMCDSYQFKKLPMWQEVPYPSVPRSPQGVRMLSVPRVSKKNVNTQTVGLFFPGGKKIHKEQEDLMEYRAREMRMSDKHPPLTAVSPGRGYWRKQLDHICGHIKAYTTNNVEFRSVVGDPRLGKVTGAGIDEGENDFTISFTFNLFDTSELGGRENRSLQRDIYKQHKSFAFGSTLIEDAGKDEQNKSLKKKRKQKKKSNFSVDKSKPEDRLLLKELSSNGSGRVSEVKQLIMEGADVNCRDGDKRTALATAVINNRAECAKSLIHAGADVNALSSVNNDTALHEAVKLGPSGKNIVEMLLDNKANMTIRNNKGLTAYDLAVKADFNSVVALFTSHKGKAMVNKMVNPKGYKKSERRKLSTDESDNDAAVF